MNVFDSLLFTEIQDYFPDIYKKTVRGAEGQKLSDRIKQNKQKIGPS